MTVTTKYGKIEGFSKNGCDVFKGIPYAKPPVGPLRFRKPQKPECWEGVRTAEHFGNKSVQLGNPRETFYKKEFYSNPDFDVPISEDCLYLNIWVPQNKGEKLPVAVYVHGGAFLGGAGSNLPFVCDELAKAGVIVVTINYRLGALGFLCHPLLGVPGENAAGGNYGLWDQLEAITWVKENIAAFGGDENNITVFGQSAGAMSLQALAVAPQSKGLFQRMILQSGGGYKNPLGEYRPAEQAETFGEDLLEALGFRSGEWKESEEKRQAAIKALWETPTEELLKALETAIAQAFIQHKGMPYVPVIDGELITDDGNILLSMKPTRDYLVCVDSDGCVFDNMELKHKECFCPATVNVWGLQSVSRYAREAAEFVNLYSKTRGMNRFPALVRTLELLDTRKEARERGYVCPDLTPLKKWIEETDSLSAKGIKEYAAAHGGDMDPVLATAARWSTEVDENIERIVHGVAPLPGVKEAFAKISQFADIVIVSATPHEAIVREWSAQGLLEHITVVAGQELGTKKDCIRKAMEGRYAPDHVLMVGDAPGDYDAAQGNGVLFYPIIPGQEVESWRRLREVAAEKFREGTYNGSYMDYMLSEFNSVLQDEPNW